MANNYNYPNMPWSGGMPNYVDLTEPEDTKPPGSILNGLLSMVQKSTSEYDSVPGTSGTPLRTSTHQLGAPDMNNPAFAGAGVPLEQSAIHESSDKDKKKNLFHVDTNLIHSIPTNQQASELQGLGLEVFNQDEFEQGVMAQVDQALEVEENERMKKMMQRELKSVEDAIRSTKQEMQHIAKVISMLTPQSSSNREAARKLQSVTKQHNDKLKQLKKMTAKQKTLSMKINGNLNGVDAEELNGDVMQVLGLPSAVDETEHERMIRLGEMTPFGTVVNKPKETPRTVSMSKTPTDFEQFLLGGPPAGAKKPTKGPASKIKRSHTVTSVPKLSSKTVDKKANGSDEPRKKKMRKSVSDSSIIQTKDDGDDFDAINKSQKFKRGDQNMFDQKDKRTYYGDMEKDFSNYKSRRRIHPKLQHNFSEDKALSDVEIGDENDVDDYKDGDADYIPEAAEFDDADMSYSPEKKSRGRRKKDDPLAGLKRKDEDENWDAGETKKSTGRKKGSGGQVVNSRDDGNLDSYEARLRQHDRDEQKKTAEKMANGEEDSDSGSDLEIDSGFKVPGRLWNKLYRYQKTGVRWLWELHCQQAGGIVGDEMGLGKTLQTIAFLRGLRYSKLVDKAEHTRYRGLGPVIIVCPATVMHQWVKEFHTWSPEFRVAVLHNSGNYKGSEDALVRSVVRRNDIIITAYSGVTMFQDILLPHRWHYIILDEGHKIRNPDAQVTLACKQFRTCHRIILSGSPVQNNLKELWSLFDFVFPGKLGTLPDFMAHFSVPIVQGGYSNATQVQVQTAYKCACVLRDTINPYLLRRMKNDVKDNLCLPDKNEQVLFCRLTDHQKEVYKEYIDSKECNMILSGKFMVFPGLITLRKICNHPDISTGGPIVFDPKEREDGDETLEYGFWKRSGKLIVVESLLKLWKQQEHRVLLFTQSKQMLNILEEFVDKQGYTYRTMDGGTPISARQPLITRFNNDPSIFVFLLTTRVGGLGVNLTGANRVVIYDPDWNPSTDLQARERSWRIGQKRNVTIYRLLTAGTIEEKIYHRQIFKTFLTNRVLKDPKQRRFFKSNDLYELFTLGDDSTKQGTETSAIFAGTGSDIKIPVKKQSSQKSGRKNRFDELKKREKEIQIEDKSVLDKEEVEDEGEESVIQVAKLQKMRELARSLSKKIGKGEITGEDKSNNETSQKLKSESTASEKTSEMTKKDKEKGKKKKKRRDASLEGVKISYLKKHKTYQPAAEEEESADSKKDDDFVLQRLLKKSGVHSALQHDKIMLSSNPDYALVEGEAERVAKEAARALKHSRTRCNAATSGIPTWTGCSGQASSPSKPRFGQKKNPKLVSSTTAAAPPVQKLVKSESVGRSSPKPQPKHFDGTIAGNKKNSSVVIAKSAPDMMSSKELLTRMQSRNHLLLESQRGEDNDEIDETYVGRVSGASVNIDPETLESITDIRNHVAFGCAIDGQATTEEIMSEFGSKISHDQSANFKAMLKQICNFDKRNGIGIWQLKPEFR